MRTGNAILVAFFVWMAIDLPFRIFTISETYFIREFIGLGRDDWIVFSFLIPFVAAVLFAIYGIEKKDEDMYYKSAEKREENKEMLSEVADHVDELNELKKENDKEDKT